MALTMLIINNHVYIIYVLSDIFFSSLLMAFLSSKLLTATLLPSVQVINFELPTSAAGYVHRVGRTGRAYNTGASISLVGILRYFLYFTTFQ